MRALLSVSDKTGLVAFAERLVAKGVELVSTGGTFHVLQQAGLPVISVETVTGFPEMMDGRVKTLHPKVHGGLLARRDVPAHMAALNEHHITPIDLVVVNLYPFKETISRSEVTEAEAIEQIDIGGPSMLRSAAKNFAAVTVVCDPADYDEVATQLQQKGHTTVALRRKLAAKVFRHTAQYDAVIARYLTELVGETTPESYTPTYRLKEVLRYGENSQQAACFYESVDRIAPLSLAAVQQLNGKELSYNNLRDADAALAAVRDFAQPACVAVKHLNPCGIGIGETIEQAFERCYAADSVSIFGGIVACNRPVTAALAEQMLRLFLEVIIAPEFEHAALELLQTKKNVRLLALPQMMAKSQPEQQCVSVAGGLLVQDGDPSDDQHHWQVVSKRQPTPEEWRALALAWKVVKHVKSNAIVLANEHQTVGIGAGQMNRVGAVHLACEQAQAAQQLAGAALASDAFFPMPDSIDLAARYGITALIHPGGSIKDQAVIDQADHYGMTLVATGVRHFKH